jgi:hypothetical protein
MTIQRRIYRVSDPSVDQINQVLAQIADRLDQIEGWRGLPVFKDEVNMSGNKIVNLADAVESSDALTKGQVDTSNFISHTLATAVNDFLVASGVGVFVAKTLAQVKVIFGLGTAAYTAATDYAVAAKGVTNGDSHDHVGGDGAQIDHGGLAGLGDDDHTQYTKHSLATAASDFLVASGAGAFIKKTLAEVKTLIGITDTSNIDPGHHHSGLWESDNGAQTIYVYTDGNVGLGDPTPASRFVVARADTSVEQAIRLTTAAGSDWTMRQPVGSSDIEFWNDDGIIVMILKVVGDINLPTISTYATNILAVGGGLVVGDIYQTSTGELRIVV